MPLVHTNRHHAPLPFFPLHIPLSSPIFTSTQEQNLIAMLLSPLNSDASISPDPTPSLEQYQTCSRNISQRFVHGRPRLAPSKTEYQITSLGRY